MSGSVASSSVSQGWQVVSNAPMGAFKQPLNTAQESSQEKWQLVHDTKHSTKTQPTSIKQQGWTVFNSQQTQLQQGSLCTNNFQQSYNLCNSPQPQSQQARLLTNNMQQLQLQQVSQLTNNMQQQPQQMQLQQSMNNSSLQPAPNSVHMQQGSLCTNSLQQSYNLANSQQMQMQQVSQLTNNMQQLQMQQVSQLTNNMQQHPQQMQLQQSMNNSSLQPAPNSVYMGMQVPADGMQQQMPYPSFQIGAQSSPQADVPVKLFTSQEKLEDKLVGVVVTLHASTSYDTMFREVRPAASPGERVSVYSLSINKVSQLHRHLTSTSPAPDMEPSWQGLVTDVRAVPADTVVFNWECCASCGDHGFPKTGAPIPFIGFALRSGWTVMCSDFSLKALIADWSEEQLGPNPFLRLASCSGRFCLEFVPDDLAQEDVPQQLKVVGELCAEERKAFVKAMSDTIVYSVNPSRAATDKYALKVLTVVTSPVHLLGTGPKCSVGEGSYLKEGLAGHVILTYSEGGQLVTSMGHWIELTQLDTSVESVFRVAEQNFGAVEAERFRQGYLAQGSAVDQYKWVQSNACQYVQQSMPCKGLQMQNRTM